uniref:Uncharacterized protein n=1 Tax=Rhizophora mucronata TaxID=61149 RepID=A0A2P2PQQ4_RHIMU
MLLNWGITQHKAKCNKRWHIL